MRINSLGGTDNTKEEFLKETHLLLVECVGGGRRYIREEYHFYVPFQCTVSL